MPWLLPQTIKHALLLCLLLLPLVPALCTLFLHIFLHVVTHSLICLSYSTLSPLGSVPVFFLMPPVSRSMGGLVPWTGITDRQYLCSWGQCRWSPCRHECGQIHDNAAAMSLGDQQTAQWFEMSQERDHTHLLGRNYLSANIKRHGLWLFLFSMVRRKRREEVQ